MTVRDGGDGDGDDINVANDDICPNHVDIQQFLWLQCPRFVVLISILFVCCCCVHQGLIHLLEFFVMIVTHIVSFDMFCMKAHLKHESVLAEAMDDIFVHQYAS